MDEVIGPDWTWKVSTNSEGLDQLATSVLLTEQILARDPLPTSLQVILYALTYQFRNLSSVCSKSLA
jgi:hypothetical protein